jgi:hypothetical protein
VDLVLGRGYLYELSIFALLIIFSKAENSAGFKKPLLKLKIFKEGFGLSQNIFTDHQFTGN